MPVRRSLVAALGACALAACQPPARATQAVAGAAAPDSVAILQDVTTLADDRFEGRRTGTAGNDSAAAYLSRRYVALRLAPPAAQAGCDAGCAGYVQPFTASEPVRNGAPTTLRSQNLAGVVRGTDPALRDEFVIIGAHFDHLGRSTTGAMDPAAGDAIRNGADDNASGSAAVLALARRFARQPARRSVVIAHFSGEEQGLLGSAKFVERPPVPLDRVVAMVNFDMVGRLRDDKLIVYGVATARELPAILDSANAATGFKLTAIGDGFGPSDHSSFYAKDIPVLHFFTDVHEDYHRATDDAEKINVGGIVRVVDLAERTIRSIADRPARLSFTRAPATVARSATPSTGNAYFGSIPDMAAADADGMRISGVSPGGPAEQAGLKGGDLIVEFGGRAVKNIYDYTDAIGAYKPGDSITVIVLRGAARERLSFRVTLGRRGGG